MFSRVKLLPVLAGILFLSNSNSLAAQDGIPWLNDYTDEMVIGNDTYRYSFSSVDGNACKLEFKESVTDKKGSSESRSWIFYLTDIDPASFRFDAKGKAIEVNMETFNTQEFISYFEEAEFKAYTDEIRLRMNDVDQTRKFIEALRENLGSCKASEATWENREAAFAWLMENVGAAKDDDVQWEQRFSRGERPYLARLSSRSVNSKGVEGSFDYLFDLSDINPLSVKLVVSGRSLGIAVPVKEGKNFIEVTTPAERMYTDELKIYADDIEEARQMVNAISYLVTNTTPERQEWDGYSQALGFVKDHLGEVKISNAVFTHSLSFEEAPSGIVDLVITENGSDGETKEATFSFYLTDMAEQPRLDVSRRAITIEMETRDDHDYIRKSSGGIVSGYTSDLEFNSAGIDVARDIIKALEAAIRNSKEDIQEFASVNEINSWMEEHFEPLFRTGEKYEQKLRVDEALQNQIVFENTLTKDDAEATETKYVIYPEDLSLEEMKIGVSSGRLTVVLKTGKVDYIRNFKNGELQNFTDDAPVYFFDPMVAKNFMAAIRFLKEHAAAREMAGTNREEALSFLTGNIPDVEIPGKKYEQKLEMTEGDPCKLRFTRVETDDGGKRNEFSYEFMASDIDKGLSKLSVNGKLMAINLVTAGNKKLIKPYENGEVEDFEDDFAIYADDVLLAKEILAAIVAMAEACQ